MSKIEKKVNTEQKCCKKLKSGLTFWSPLNDSFGLPNKQSKCTWHQKVDKSTNPHNTAEW